jgi:hypothetical protein
MLFITVAILKYYEANTNKYIRGKKMSNLQSINSIKKNINFSIKFTKREKKAFKVIIERFEKGLGTWLEDLKPYVKDQSDTATRKLASRLVKKGICKFISRGILIPEGYDEDKELMENVNLSVLTKARSVRHRKNIIYTMKHFVKNVKPFLKSKQNQWSDLLAHNISAKFQIDGEFYNKLIEIAPQSMKPTKNKDYMIIIEDPNTPYRKTIFHVYPNRVILQIGTTDLPVRANEQDFRNAINLSRNYLIQVINQFLNLNLHIPSIDEWDFTVTHLHHDTINKDYMAYYGSGIEDNGLAIHLYNHIKKGRNCLRVEVKLTKIQLKLRDIFHYFNKNDPFNILQNHA